MRKGFIFIATALTAGTFMACQQQAGSTSSIVIEKQGVFSSGGRVTAPVPGEYDATQNWLDMSRKGTTTHVDHANTFYQIPANGNGHFMFQEKNNAQIADLFAAWLENHDLN